MSKKMETMLNELRLPGIRDVYKSQCEDARKEGLSYERLLESLLEIECIERRNNKTQRLLRGSRIRIEKTKGNFDIKRLPLSLLSRVNRLWDGDFVLQKENVLCFGAPGSGKTHLLSALGLELIQKGYKVEMYTCSLLVQALLGAKAELSLERLLKKLSRNDAIFIDDIGYVQQTRDEMDVLFTFLAHCYETTSLLVTSNLPFSKWNSIFKDAMTTAAAIDRLVHHSVIIELNLDSYRMMKAKKAGQIGK